MDTKLKKNCEIFSVCSFPPPKTKKRETKIKETPNLAKIYHNMYKEKERNTITSTLDERNRMKEEGTSILTQEEDPVVQFVGLKDIDDPFNERYDHSSSPWLLLRTILILPLTLIRIILITGIIVIFSSLLILVIRGERYSRLRGWKKRLFELVYYCGNRMCLFIIGVYWLKTVEVKESTLAAYQEIVRSRHVATTKKKETDSQNKNHDSSTYKLDPDLYSKYDIDPAAIVVSNHVCPFDPFLVSYSFDNPITFVAKAEVKQSILAVTTKMMEVLYVEKNNQEKLIHDMYERIREYYEHLSARNKKKGDTEQIVDEQEEDEQRPPPLVIFSEGTTTSGYQMLKFHTGAFRFGAPVSPLVIRFPYKWFNMVSYLLVNTDNMSCVSNANLYPFVIGLDKYYPRLEILFVPLFPNIYSSYNYKIPKIYSQ